MDALPLSTLLFLNFFAIMDNLCNSGMNNIVGKHFQKEGNGDMFSMAKRECLIMSYVVLERIIWCYKAFVLYEISEKKFMTFPSQDSNSNHCTRFLFLLKYYSRDYFKLSHHFFVPFFYFSIIVYRIIETTSQGCLFPINL